MYPVPIAAFWQVGRWRTSAPWWAASAASTGSTPWPRPRPGESKESGHLSKGSACVGKGPTLKKNRNIIYIYTYIHVFMYVCIYAHTFIYVCMYACMYVCMHVCMHVCTYVRTYGRMYVCMYVCTYVCTYLSVYIYIYIYRY